MNEKQKAKELIEEFYRYAKGQTNEARLINAKFSAIKCVDEILSVQYSVNGIKYWCKVKTEIQNYEP